MLSFQLTPSFVAEFEQVKPKWGYTDSVGNSLGEITYLRTYSRKKADGTKERWFETCERVINGMFSILKDHCVQNRLPWSDERGQKSAQEAYTRLFEFKWTPPGRGLWTMGTPFVHEQGNSAALQNCFAGTTEFVTEDGVRTLADAEGETVRVATEKGWLDAEVRAFGSQPLHRITFAPAMPNSRSEGWRLSRSNVRHVIEATPDHRWVLTDGTVTTALIAGDTVPAQVAEVEHDPDPKTPGGEHSEEYLTGWRHGFVFGDGNVATHSARRYEAPLHGADEKWEHRFPGGARYTSSWGAPVCVVHSDDDLKALPEGRTPTYLSGFMDGWMAADGSITASGSVALASSRSEAQTWLERHAALAGWLYVGRSEDDRETNYGPRTAPLVKHVLTRDTERAWKVVAIEALPEPETVYCAVVPATATFTLAQGILTGNCAFVSTEDMCQGDPSRPFAFLMEASMLGVGVGFDTLGAECGLDIHQPIKHGELPEVEHLLSTQDPEEAIAQIGTGAFDVWPLSTEDVLRAVSSPWDGPRYVISDTREGWVASTAALIRSYLQPNHPEVQFVYDGIRPRDTEILGFGGKAGGVTPLIDLHTRIRQTFEGRAGSLLTSRDITDVQNMIGVCVVAGNVRRSAELALGRNDDKDFIELKDWRINPERAAWANASNNSVMAEVGMDYQRFVDPILFNGEPGFVYMDLQRSHGRLADEPTNADYRAKGTNPCAEQTLESYECCTLVETFPTRATDMEDYLRTLKFAFMYAKAVTLLPTHWPETNAVMQRNRRIGASMSGMADFVELRDWHELAGWMDSGYATIKRWDTTYSEWLGVRESIKVTSVKPSGTVSLLAGVSPGAHWPVGDTYIRRIRLRAGDPIGQALRDAGYTVEPARFRTDEGEMIYDETTWVAEIPLRGQGVRTEREVSVYEKAGLAEMAQRWWADNAVSLTLSFHEEEGAQLPVLLRMFEGRLKAVSFLKIDTGSYEQMPYENLTDEEYEAASAIDRLPLDWAALYGGDALDAVGEAYCTTDACEIKDFKIDAEEAAQ